MPESRDLGFLDLSQLNSSDLQSIEPINRTSHVTDICWNVGKRCNYACSYCWKDLHDFASPHRTFQELVNAWLNLKGQISPKSRPFRITFTGGEPTLNPDFHRFVGFLNTERDYIGAMGLTTNGSESLSYYENIFNSLDWICFSTHFEWWDERDFLEKVLDLWRHTGRNKHGKWLTVNLMYENWEGDAVRRIHTILKEEGIPQTAYKIVNFYGSKGIKNKISEPFDYDRYRQSRGDLPKSSLVAASVAEQDSGGDLTELMDKDQKAPDNADIVVGLRDGRIGKTNSTQLMNYGLANFPGWICEVDKNLYIHNDGTVWAGNCFFQRLGNAYEGFEPLSEAVTCDGRFCSCTIDICCKKFNPSPREPKSVPEKYRREAIDKSPKNALGQSAYGPTR